MVAYFSFIELSLGFNRQWVIRLSQLSDLVVSNCCSISGPRAVLSVDLLTCNRCAIWPVIKVFFLKRKNASHRANSTACCKRVAWFFSAIEMAQ